MVLLKESKPTIAVATNGRHAGDAASHIARIAARLFAERGYDATSVREIVEAAGVTKPTLYYHFGSKKGLADALLTRPMTELLASLRSLIEEPLGPIELLRRMFEVHIALVTEEPDRARFLYGICFGPRNSSLQEEMFRFGGAIDNAKADFAARLADAGVIDPARVESCTRMIRGLIMTSTLDHLLIGRPLEPGLADRLVVDLLKGFGRPGFDFDGEREGRR